MAAELEKLARVLRAKGYTEGSQIISSIGNALLKGDLIPERLDEPLPPFVFDRPSDIPNYIHEIDALNLSPRTRNVLVRAEKTNIRELHDASDEILLQTRHLGKSGLAELRRSLADFKERIVSQRQRDGAEDDSVAILPYPTKIYRGKI